MMSGDPQNHTEFVLSITADEVRKLSRHLSETQQKLAEAEARLLESLKIMKDFPYCATQQIYIDIWWDVAQRFLSLPEIKQLLEAHLLEGDR